MSLEYTPTTQHKPYPDPAAPPSTSGSATGASSSTAVVPAAASSGAVTSSTTPAFPDEIDLQSIPDSLKKEGSDWFAVFNSNVKRVLNVSLVHTFVHERCVDTLNGLI